MPCTRSQTLKISIYWHVTDMHKNSFEPANVPFYVFWHQSIFCYFPQLFSICNRKTSDQWKILAWMHQELCHKEKYFNSYFTGSITWRITCKLKKCTWIILNTTMAWFCLESEDDQHWQEWEWITSMDLLGSNSHNNLQKFPIAWNSVKNLNLT